MRGRNSWRRIRARRWTPSEKEMAMKLKAAEVELRARENYLDRREKEDAGKFAAMEKRLEERVLRLEKTERDLDQERQDFARAFRDSSSLICDGCDVPLGGGHVAVRLVNTNVDYCVECMQVGCIAVDPDASELSPEDQEEYRLAASFMIGKALRAAHDMRRRQSDLTAGGKVPLFRPGMAQPLEGLDEMRRARDEQALATIPEEEVEATDIGPPDDPNTSKRSSSRPPGSQQSGGQMHGGGPQAGGRGNQQSGGRVRDGGPRSGGHAKSEKKLAKKARQRKAKQRAEAAD